MGTTADEHRQRNVGEAIQRYLAERGTVLPLTTCVLVGDVAVRAYLLTKNDPAPYPLDTPGAEPAA
jgi:hypothetical protein